MVDGAEDVALVAVSHTYTRVSGVCQVLVTPPAGQGSPFNITADRALWNVLFPAAGTGAGRRPMAGAAGAHPPANRRGAAPAPLYLSPDKTGCASLNADLARGKVVVVDRGACKFTVKVCVCVGVFSCPFSTAGKVRRGN